MRPVQELKIQASKGFIEKKTIVVACLKFLLVVQTQIHFYFRETSLSILMV